MPELTQLLSLLRSDDPEERSNAIERAAVAIERLAHAVVNSLEGAGTHQQYVAEHVHRFGTSMIEPLEDLLNRTSDENTRVLCALLLLRLHSPTGVPVHPGWSKLPMVSVGSQRIWPSAARRQVVSSSEPRSPQQSSRQPG